MTSNVLVNSLAAKKEKEEFEKKALKEYLKNHTVEAKKPRNTKPVDKEVAMKKSEARKAVREAVEATTKSKKEVKVMKKNGKKVSEVVMTTARERLSTNGNKTKEIENVINAHRNLPMFENHLFIHISSGIVTVYFRDMENDTHDLKLFIRDANGGPAGKIAAYARQAFVKKTTSKDKVLLDLLKKFNNRFIEIGPRNISVFNENEVNLCVRYLRK